jgi:hypothetical protein
MAFRGVLRHAHWNIVGHDDDFRFKVDAPIFVGKQDRVARPDKAVGPALIHDWIVIKVRRQFGAPRFPQTLQMIEIDAPVTRLVGTRQR